MSLGLPPRRLSRGLLRTMDELPVMNALNAPAELCEAVKERFLAFLNGFVVTDQTDAELSQSITHSQGSGAGRAPPLLPVAGLGLAPSLPGNVRGMLDTLASRRPLPAGFEWRELPGPCRGPPQPAAALLRGAAGHHEGAGAQVPVRELRARCSVRPGRRRRVAGVVPAAGLQAQLRCSAVCMWGSTDGLWQ